LPFVIPKLVKHPFTLFNCKALASVSEASGPALFPYLGNVMSPILENMFEEDLEVISAFAQCGERIVLTYQKDDFPVIQELIKLTRSEKVQHRLGAVYLIGIFAEKTKLDYTSVTCPMISCLLEMYNDFNPKVQSLAIKSMTKIEGIDKEKGVNFVQEINVTLDIIVRDIRNRITLGRSEVNILPGLCLPGGLDSILPLYLNSLRAGNTSQREMALEGIRYILQLASPEALKTHIIKIVGPLIRIFTEKTLATSVKLSILQTISILMDKGGENLKTAATQLQTTYTKALSDPAPEVREEAAPGLSRLLSIGARKDFILKDILRVLSSSSGLPAISITTAVQSLLTNSVEQPIKPDTLSQLQKELLKNLSAEENLRIATAQCFGPFVLYLKQEETDALLPVLLVSAESPDWPGIHGGLLALESILFKSLKNVISQKAFIIHYIQATARSEKVVIRQAVAKVIALIFENYPQFEDSDIGQVFPIILTSLEDPSAEVKVTALQVIKNSSKLAHKVFWPYLPKLVPIVFNHAKERKLVRVKFAGERCLYHLLQFYRDNSVLNQLCKNPNFQIAKELTEYCKKVLSKLNAPSDDDGYTIHDTE